MLIDRSKFPQSDEAGLPFSALLLVAALVIIVWIVQKARLAIRSPLKSIPAPWYAHWTNLRLKLAVVTGQRIHYVHALHERFGPIVRISPHEVSVADPAAVNTIHKINSGYVKSSWYTDLVNLPRTGVFSMSDPREHAVRRKLFARPFSKSYLRQVYEPAVRSLVRGAVSKIVAEANRAGVVDVLKWWTFMATDVSASLFFGDSFHMVERGEVNEYIRVLQAALKGGGIGAELPFVRAILKPIPIKSLQEVFRGNDFLLKYGLESRKMSKDSGDDRTIFAAANREAQEVGGAMDELDVLVEAQGLLVAGSDTTAVSLTYLVWAVLSHPQWQTELEQEVASLSSDFQDADLEKLPVLNAIIEETLRLYGAAPGGLPRVVPKSGGHMGKYFVPEGTTVTTQSYTLHRSPEQFPEPEKFEPRRWLQNNERWNHNIPPLSDTARAMYSPFGFGSRTCLGIHLARMEMRLAVVEFFRMCRGAKLAPSTTPDSMQLENFFLIAPKGHKCEVTLA